MEQNTAIDAAADPHRNDGTGVYRFREFELDLSALELRQHGREVTLTPKSMSALVYLFRNRDRAVTRTELLQELWPNVRVCQGSLSQAIWEVRTALQDRSDGARIIQTLRGRGYRFAAQVEPRVMARSGLASALHAVGAISFDAPGLHRFAELIQARSESESPATLEHRMRRLTEEDLLLVLELATLLASDRAERPLRSSTELSALPRDRGVETQSDAACLVRSVR